MHILFVIDPLPGLAAYKDTSVSMMQALVARGHQISVTHQNQLYIDADEVKATTRPITLVPDADLHGTGWWRWAGTEADQPLQAFDAVLMRKDPPFDMEYLYATHMADHAAARGARVFNTGQAMRDHPEKLAILEFPQFTAPTLVSSRLDQLRAFYARHKDIVVKPLDGMGGAGVFRIQPGDHNLGSILETLTHNESTTIMAQRYLPAIVEGDKRIILINGEAIPYALARVPLAGELRGNLAAGAQGVAQPLTDNDRAIAQALGPILAKRGLLLVGLDVIGDHLTEINVTSPTGFVEITQQTDVNVACRFAQALESVVDT